MEAGPGLACPVYKPFSTRFTVDIAFWQERWQRGEIGFHQSNINPYLAYYYGEKGPDPKARAGLKVFVPLCGKSTDITWLSQNGYAVTGVECSQAAIEDFFTEQNIRYDRQASGEHLKYASKAIELYQGDFFSLQKQDLGTITDVYDRAALIALPEAMRTRYVMKMVELLEPGSRTLLVTLSYPQHEMDGPPFSVTEDEVHTLYDEYFSIDKLCAKNILEMEQRFKQKGLSTLVETAYKLVRK